jgi:hypothetical protein
MARGDLASGAGLDNDSVEEAVMKIKNLICGVGILLALGLPVCFATDPPVAISKPRVVDVGTATYRGITRITLTADRRILLTHSEGVAGFAVEQLPRDFLEAWGFTDIALEMGFALAAEDSKSDPLSAPTLTPQEQPRKVESSPPRQTAPQTVTGSATPQQPAAQQQNAPQNSIRRLAPFGGYPQLQSQPQALPAQQPTQPPSQQQWQQQFNNWRSQQPSNNNPANPAMRFGSGRRTRPPAQ